MGIVVFKNNGEKQKDCANKCIAKLKDLKNLLSKDKESKEENDKLIASINQFIDNTLNTIITRENNK